MDKLTEQDIRNIIRDELSSFLRPDKFTFTRPVFVKDLYISDGSNIKFSSVTGTKIGTATTEKLSLYGVTPVVQAGAISAPSGGLTVDAEARTAINSIRTALTNIGITA